MAGSRHVRFTPHSGHSSVQVGCSKSARSGRAGSDPSVSLPMTSTAQRASCCWRNHSILEQEGNVGDNSDAQHDLAAG
jgi:hypothetical protein